MTRITRPERSPAVGPLWRAENARRARERRREIAGRLYLLVAAGALFFAAFTLGPAVGDAMTFTAHCLALVALYMGLK